MAVISRAIPTLLRGVSQAADLTKRPDHADIQDNANSSPVQGLIKRSGSQYITNLSDSTLGNVHIQTINRDVNERYIAVFSNGNVKVYDLDGNEKTVNKHDGVTYLTTTNPRDEIKTVTIADYTFVVNTSITVEMDTAVSQGGSVGALVFINQVTSDTDYSVTVDSTTATYNTGTTNLKTSTVAADLKSDLDGGLSGFTVTQNGPVLWIRKNDGSDFSIDATDTQGNSQITLVKNSVQTFTDLPTTAPNNFVVEVKGDDTTNFDNYYVKFVTNNGGTFEEGQWEETLKAGITYKFNYDKMPHVLLRQADGNFRFARADGDSYTALASSGTYSQSGTTVTVTSTNHNFGTGQTLVFNFQSGGAVDDTTTITKTGSDTFTFTADNPLSTNGNVIFGTNGKINGTYTQSLQIATVNAVNHGFSVGDKVTLDFTSSSSASSDIPDGTYTIESVVNADSFTVDRAENTDVGYATGFSGSGTFSYDDSNHLYTLPKWRERTVGDEDTAPNPTFVGTKINNVFFFRNRLGFLADDNVCMSTVSEFFNFYPETVTTIVDSDPIDIAASHTKVSILKHAVTMGEQLILFSDQTQFILESSIAEALTPKTANVTVATEFENNTAATPVGAGSSIYFLTKKGSFSGVREYITQEDINIKDAADTTVHVPRYIEDGIFKMAISTNENVLVLLGTDSPNKLYINRWLYGNSFEKVLNSWCTYTFNSAKTIRNIDFIDTDLYLVIEEANGTTLEKIPFESDYKETNADFEYHLDHKVTEAALTKTGTYVMLNTFTTVTITCIDHGLSTGNLIAFDFTSGNAVDGTFVITKINNNSFSFTAAAAALSTTNGDVSFTSIVAYDSATGLTTFTLPYRLNGDMNIIGRHLASNETSTYVNAQGATVNLKPGQVLQTTNTSNGSTTTITATGDFTNSKFIIGEPFEMHYRFSQQRLTQGEGAGSELISGRLQLHHFYIKYEDTGFFKVEVTPDYRDTNTYTFSGNVLGAASSTIGSINLATGMFKVPVMSKADRVNIDIKNNTFLPAKLASAEYEAMFHMRSRRI